MPHLFVNRLRKHSIVGGSLDNLRHQFKWEVINAICYLSGGITFIVGSVFFLPQYEAKVDLGAWLFIIGSFLYLGVEGHDLYEVIHSKTKTNKLVDAFAASAYVIGGILFIIGSWQFLPTVGAYTAGAYNFIFGSILFIAGAVTNSIQIFDSPTKESALYANFTAVCYVIGSTLFLSGSVPYLWYFESTHDLWQVHRYLGSQFVFGSILFVVGGLFNLWRAYLIFQHGLIERMDHFQSKHNTCPSIETEYHGASLMALPHLPKKSPSRK